MTWHAIADTHLLEGRHNHRKPHGYHAKDTKKRLTRILQHFYYEE